MRPLFGLAALAALAACGTHPPGPASRPLAGTAPPPSATPNVPDFASRPYDPFRRSAAVAIALREWRLWGQGVDDDPPDTRPPLPPELKPERMAGLWQRVGEYWYEGQDLGRPEAFWTGIHGTSGDEFPADADGDYAWSAAFISYVMRIAGATTHWPYSPSHHSYINEAARQALGQASGWDVTAAAPDQAAPAVGDLICFPRTARPLRFQQLPAGYFPAHCDIVVLAAAGVLSVVGGNVDDAVTMKHVPVTADGLLAPPGGRPVDTRYPWFAVLRVAYEAP